MAFSGNAFAALIAATNIDKTTSFFGENHSAIFNVRFGANIGGDFILINPLISSATPAGQAYQRDSGYEFDLFTQYLQDDIEHYITFHPRFPGKGGPLFVGTESQRFPEVDFSNYSISSIELILNAVSITTEPDSGWREGYRTDIAINADLKVYGSVVPIPAAVWLFGSALLGLGWFRQSATESPSMT